MTKSFTEIIKLSNSSVKSFEIAEKRAKSIDRIKRDAARKERRVRISRMKESV